MNDISEHIEKVPKTREEQEKDFEIISQWANPGCQVCLGKGYSGYHIQLQQLLPCSCVYKNIDKARAEENANFENGGLILKTRELLGINN